MLSSSHFKIHDPRVTGVSHDPRAADQCQEVRNTRVRPVCPGRSNLAGSQVQAAVGVR
jgi:hypothetical protein